MGDVIIHALGFLILAITVTIVIVPLVLVTVAVIVTYRRWRTGRTVRSAAMFLVCVLISLPAIVFLARHLPFSLFLPSPPTAVEPWQPKVYDRVIKGDFEYILVHNSTGFVDVMQGVILYRFPLSLKGKHLPWGKRYELFDEALVDDTNRSVTSAKIDLEMRLVSVKFDQGKDQIIKIPDSVGGAVQPFVAPDAASRRR